jgi:DNA polymerase V
MTDLLVLDLVEKHLVTNQLVLTIGYDIDNLTDLEIIKSYTGDITTDRYGRKIPKHAHGTINLKERTSSTRLIMEAIEELYDKIINKKLLVRRINVVANNVVNESEIMNNIQEEQISLFIDYEQREKEKAEELKNRKQENNLQHAILDIKKKYGKNAILKGMNLDKNGTTIERNAQIGGHKE